MTKKSNTKNKMITVVGIIVPAVWDEKGNPINVAISSTDEQEFIIESRNKNGKEVEKLLRQRIQISGELLDSKGSRKKIRVKSYTKLDDNQIGEKDRGLLKAMGFPNSLNESWTNNTPSNSEGK